LVGIGSAAVQQFAIVIQAVAVAIRQRSSGVGDDLEDLSSQVADVDFAVGVLAPPGDARNGLRRGIELGRALLEIGDGGAVIAERPNVAATVVGIEIGRFQVGNGTAAIDGASRHRAVSASMAIGLEG